MPENPNPTANEMLRLYLETPQEEKCAEYLSLLIEKHALPVIEKSLKKKFKQSSQYGFYWSPQDFEDLSSESCLRLVKKLSASRKKSEHSKIRDFKNYTASIAYNCFNEFFGKRAPNWKSLKNKIRYAVGNSIGLEIWRERNESFCSLIENIRQFRQISADELFTLIEKEVEDFRNIDLPELIYEILKKANSAIRLNELVSITARLWAIDDLPDASLDDFWTDGFSFEKEPRNDLEMRYKLSNIWQEISQLSVNQRIALLYNLRDKAGREMLLMFFNSKIATLQEISEAMNLSFEECAKIMPRLPMKDKIIAERMKLTTKQVGSLRKVARENLKRRVTGKTKRKSRADETKIADWEKNNGNNLDPVFGEN